MSSFEKSRTKKMMMKSETAKKKRAKKTTTRATQSDHRVIPVVHLSFALREHRHNKSRQAQTLERGASRSTAVIRRNDQFKHGDIRKFNLVFLDFAYRIRWAEIPLLAHDFSKRASAVRRPPQDELLGALYRGFFEDERDACESLRLIEDQPDGLSAGIGGTPAPHFSWDQCRLDRIILFFRCDLDHGCAVKVQPFFVAKRSILRNRRD